MRPATNGPRSLTRTSDLAAVRRIADARVARDRQGRVGGGHRVHVVDLAARRLPAVELATVPGREAALAERHVARRRHVLAAERLVRLVGAAGADRLDARLGVGDARQVGRRIGARPVGVARQRARLRRHGARRLAGGSGGATAQHRCHREGPSESRRAGRRQDEAHGDAPYPNAAHALPPPLRLPPPASQPVRLRRRFREERRGSIP